MATKDILYIEDNFHNRRIVRKILEREGYTLYECEDGLEGYEILRTMKPPVVLLDISLPSMDGMEIAKRVKEDPELQQIYLIALTASAMQGDRERFLDGGCDDYMSKPFRALDLVEMVNRYSDLAGESGTGANVHQTEAHLAVPAEIESAPEAEPVLKVDVLLPSVDELTEPVTETAPVMDESPAEEEPTAPVFATEPEVEENAPAAEEPSMAYEPTSEEAAPAPADEPAAEAFASVAEEPAAEYEEVIETMPVEEAQVVEPEVEPTSPEGTPFEAQEADYETAAVDAAPAPAAEPEVEPVQLEETVEEMQFEEDAAVVEAFSQAAAPSAEAEPVVEEVFEETEKVNEVENDKLADTAELSIDPVQEQSAWSMATETVELQQTTDDEAFFEDVEELTEELQAFSAPAVEVEPEIKTDGSQTPASSKSVRSIDAIRAGIMGVINPDNLKPVDPNSYQDQP